MIKKKLSLIISKLSTFLIRIANFIYTPPPTTIVNKQKERIKPWFAANGDKTLRLNYELNENSIVIDLGGYQGQWASDIYSMYSCRISVFEPYPDYYKIIKQRFSKNNKIDVYNFGLDRADKIAHLSVDNDASTIFKSDENSVAIQLKKATNFFKDHEFLEIDLMKVNIEGGEYDLLEHLIEEDFITIIDNIQVQFHDFVDNATERMNAIQNNLRKTHYITYQYEFVWENWKRK